MKLLRVHADGYRNLTEIDIHPHEGMNINYGQNAQGKTNLIEAISLFSGRMRLHSQKDGREIAFDRESACLDVSFADEKREQTAKIVLAKKNQFFLNRVPLVSLSEFCNVFYTVTFLPSDLLIVQGEPRLRRKFSDDAVAQIHATYSSFCGDYERVLSQRNALLKNMGKNAAEVLEVWDLQLARLGTIITILREDYFRKLLSFFQKIYEEISTKTEQVSLKYHSTVFENELGQTYTDDKVSAYLDKLKCAREQDMLLGYTSVGVHRDDFEVKINGNSAREYGSQGQQRSIVISLKLAQAKLLKSIVGTEPIVLLDDVMSELDAKRQEYILNHVRHNQVFLTCCDINNTTCLKDGMIYHMKNGRIRLETKKK